MGKPTPQRTPSHLQGAERWSSSTNVRSQAPQWKPALNTLNNSLSISNSFAATANNYGNDIFDYSQDEFESDDELENEDPQAVYDVERGVSAAELAQIWNRSCAKQRSKPQTHHHLQSSKWQKIKDLGILKEVSEHLYSQAPRVVRISMTWAQTDVMNASKSRTTQTEQMPQATVGSMVPEDLTIVGDAILDQNNTNNSLKRGCKNYTSSKSKFRESQLTYFAAHATHIVETILKPRQESASLSEVLQSKLPLGQLSDGKVDLFYEGFLTGRRLEFIYFKDSSSSIILCGYSPSRDLGTPYARQGCICVYNALMSSQPIKVLVLEGSPLCTCWLETTRRKGNPIVMTGTDVGNLALWDLSNESLIHPTSQLETLRPSYSTNYQIDENHACPIRSIICTNMAVDMNPNGAIKETLSLGGTGEIMKILTLDNIGVVHIWVIKEVLRLSEEDNDPGLMPGELLYLVRTGEMRILPYYSPEITLEIGLPEVCLFTPFPNSTHEILVAINNGTLTRATLVGSPGSPRNYSCRALGQLPPSLVVSVCFSPFAEDCFLVAYADATIALFTVDKDTPWRVWSLRTSAAQVVAAQWSFVNASMFLVMDSSGVIHVWDLAENVGGPSFTESMFYPSEQNNENQIALAFQVSKCSTSAKEHTFTIGGDNNHVYLHLMRKVEKQPSHLVSCYGAEQLRKCLADPFYR